MDYIFSKSFFFIYIISTNSRKGVIGFTPGVFQCVYLELFISFVHSVGTIIKAKCSPFNQGVIQQPIMSINKVITPMAELSDPPSYLLDLFLSSRLFKVKILFNKHQYTFVYFNDLYILHLIC